MIICSYFFVVFSVSDRTIELYERVTALTEDVSRLSVSVTSLITQITVVAISGAAFQVIQSNLMEERMRKERVESEKRSDKKSSDMMDDVNVKFTIASLIAVLIPLIMSILSK